MDKTKALFSAFFLFLVLPICAQTGKLFDPDHQLSSSFTSQVFQDHDGLIWVLTRNGITWLDRIFERFYQVSTSVNDRNAGTGIGLDLARSLVIMIIRKFRSTRT
jgi:ligand-binding sensor domain-containing protein